MSASNPWITEMSECRFEVQGVERSYRLTWRAIEPHDLGARRTALTQRVSPPFGLKTLDDGGVWLSMPLFNGDPNSEACAVLTALLTQATEKQARLRAAPYIVLDVRDNGGSSSHWSARLSPLSGFRSSTEMAKPELLSQHRHVRADDAPSVKVKGLGALEQAMCDILGEQTLPLGMESMPQDALRSTTDRTLEL